MVRFYDPKDEAELFRVEALLSDGGIEYFLRRESDPELAPYQILVAEEDIPKAEQLVTRSQLH